MIEIATFPRTPIEPGSHLHQMFAARAAVFRDRLHWEVDVEGGLEIDRYDRDEDPVYLLDCEGDEVFGSLRVLPTTGNTMLRDAFAGMFDEPVDFQSPTAWECTRFCIHPNAERIFQKTSRDLVIGICELALREGIDQIVGLYDERMTRVYRKIGWSPAELTRSRRPEETLIVGIWDVSEAALAAMKSKEAAARAA